MIELGLWPPDGLAGAQRPVFQQLQWAENLVLLYNIICII